MSQTPITVIVPCKNELPNIDACLDSVRDLADEILAADSGSTDGTLERVRSRGDCRVIEREYVNSADFKNWAIPQAQHEWVLLVDADERVSDELRDEIQRLKQTTLATTDLDAYWIRRRNFFMGRAIRFSGWQNDGVIRLFRRSCRYQAKRVHAELEVAESRTGRLTQPLWHHTYRSFAHYLEKMQRYTTWGAEDVHHRGRRFRLFDLTLRPPLRFFRHYILKLGILDGTAGFTIACLSATSVFLKYAKLWELEATQGGHTPAEKQPQTPQPQAAVSRRAA